MYYFFFGRIVFLYCVTLLSPRPPLHPFYLCHVELERQSELDPVTCRMLSLWDCTTDRGRQTSLPTPPSCHTVLLWFCSIQCSDRFLPSSALMEKWRCVVEGKNATVLNLRHSMNNFQFLNHVWFYVWSVKSIVCGKELVREPPVRRADCYHSCHAVKLHLR